MDTYLVQLIKEWDDLKAQVEAVAKPLIDKERALRQLVADAMFDEPHEGTNYVDLESEWRLKLTYKLDRKIDEAMLATVKEQLASMNVSIDKIVKWKPEVVLKAYRELTAEQMNVFDQAVVIKPGTPALEMVPPKEK